MSKDKIPVFGNITKYIYIYTCAKRRDIREQEKEEEKKVPDTRPNTR